MPIRSTSVLIISSLILLLLSSCAKPIQETAEPLELSTPALTDGEASQSIDSTNNDDLLLQNQPPELEIGDGVAANPIKILQPTTLEPLPNSTQLPPPDRLELDSGRLESGQNLLNRGLEPTLYFGFDQYNLNEKTRLALQAHLNLLQADANLNIQLEGHTDERGTTSYNLALGLYRASAVAQFLMDNGIARQRIQVGSFGEERPALIGHAEIYWRYNRRVEIYYQ